MRQAKRIAAAVLAAALMIALFPATLAALPTAYDAGPCGTNVSYYFDFNTSVLTFHVIGSGSGGMWEFGVVGDSSSERLPAPWLSRGYADKIKAVAFEDGINYIGSNAFFNCASLARITIPADVKSIGTSAFYGCGALADLSFMGTVPPVLGDAAFTKIGGSLSSPPTIRYPVSAAGDYEELLTSGKGKWHDMEEYMPAPFEDMPSFTPDQLEEMKQDIPIVYGVEYAAGAVSYMVTVQTAYSRAYAGAKVRVMYNGTAEVITLSASGKGSGSFPAQPGEAHFSAEMLSGPYPGAQSNKTLKILGNGKIAER